MIDPTDQLEKAPDTPSRIALAHDWLVGLRGGELVLDQIIRTLQEMHADPASIFTMFDTGAPITAGIDALPRTVSALNKYPAPLRRWLLMRYPSAVESLSGGLEEQHRTQPIDLLISTSSAAIKSMRAPGAVPHLCYCHSPARYLWSRTTEYAQGGIKGSLRAIGLRGFGNRLRAWDMRTADRVDRFIANSTHTADQIREHYGRESVVIHPPVRTGFFTPSDTPRTDSLLLVSALEPYKRVDLAISAALQTNRSLTIVGTGSHEKALRKHAHRAQKHHASKHQITFLGRINDEQLREQYRRAGAFLFPQIEDFGITAVEAQSCGCPVIAHRAGGALDSVIENETGVFFDRPTAESFAGAIRRSHEIGFDEGVVCAHAQRFGEQRFRTAMRAQISGLLG